MSEESVGKKKKGPRPIVLQDHSEGVFQKEDLFAEGGKLKRLVPSQFEATHDGKLLWLVYQREKATQRYNRDVRRAERRLKEKISALDAKEKVLRAQGDPALKLKLQIEKLQAKLTKIQSGEGE